jgi:simple sugar transport system permease protein
LGRRLAIGILAGALLALVHAFFSIHLRTDQIISGTAVNFLAFGITGYIFNDIWGQQGAISQGGVPPLPPIPNVDLDFVGSIPPHELGTFLKDSLTDLNLLTIAAFALVPITYVIMFKTPLGPGSLCSEHPRAADTVGIDIYAVATRLS